ncbi:MAG: neuraminidase-like domain-containing protein [Myxococcota bacterium]
MAETVSDKQGHFSFDLGEFVASGESGTEYQLRVLDGITRLTVSGDVRWSEGTDARELVVCVTYPSACSTVVINPPEGVTVPTSGVWGQIRHADGSALDGLHVVLRSIGLTGESDVFGTPSTTHSGGWYSFSAPATQLDLVVKVFEPGTPDRYVGSSKVYYKATAPLRIDVVVCDEELRGPSEYQRLTDAVVEAIAPTLISALPTTLDVRRLAWLSGRTGWSLDLVTQWELARQFSSPTVLGVDAEPLYGLMREGFPRTKDGILARSPSAIRGALSAAQGSNIISNAVIADDVVLDLQTARADALDDGGLDALGSILRTSQDLGQAQALTDPQIADFCTLYASFTGTDEEFWAEVGDLSSFTPAAVSEAQRLVRLGTIGLGFAPCVTSMLWQLGTAAADGVATWTTAIWKKIAGDESPPSWTHWVNPLPDGLEGATDAEKRASLALLLQQHAHLAYPSQSIAEALKGASATFPLSSNFFTLNPSIDLRNVKLRAGAGWNFGAQDEEDTIDELRKVQRLFRISPSADSVTAMTRLSDLGFTSARDVSRAGRTRFIETYIGGDETRRADAVEISKKAQSQTAMAAAFFMQAHPSLSRLGVAFVADDATIASAVTEADIPGWTELFGTVSGCRCRHCRSIHGPAAYLVDLLQWLDGRTPLSLPSGAPATALEALTARRPDLTALPLTCENTERVLPYIDLTLEILEAVAAGVALDANVRSSEAETPELLAAPQYVNTTAYDVDHLGGPSTVAKKAPRTPFHRALVEMRTFLGHLKVDRTELMRDFGLQASDPPTVREIACEELGLSVEAATVLETPGNASTEPANWALASLSTAPTVKSFRRAAEVTYPEILDLLHTRVVNANRSDLVSVHVVGADLFDVSNYQIGRMPVTTVDPPTIAEFSAMRQFVRLRRATGWTILELDKVLAGFGHDDPTVWSSSSPITDVGNVHRLARMTELGPVELVAWFTTMDTWEDRETADEPVFSLYDRTWLNPSIFPASLVDDPVTAFPFKLNSTRTEVNDTTLLLASYPDELRAVLGIDADELSALLTALAITNVSLANLSLLYRWVSLARVVGLDPTDAVALSDLCGIDPFSSGQNAIDFIDEARELREGGWTVDEIQYLLRHQESDRVAPTDEFLRAALGRLRDALRAAYATEGAGVSLASLLDDLGRRVAEELGVDRTVIDELRARTWTYGNPGVPSGAVVRLPAEEEVSLTSAGTITVAASAGASYRLAALATFQPAEGGGTISVPAGTGFTQEETSASLGISAGAAVRLPAGTEVQIDGTTAGYTFSADDRASLVAETALTFPGSVDVVLNLTTGARRGTFTSGTGVGAILEEDAEITLSATTTAGLPADLQGTDFLRRLLRTTFWDVEVDTTSGDPWVDIVRNDTTQPTYDLDYDLLEVLGKGVMLLQKLGTDEDERAAYYDRLLGWTMLDPAHAALSDLTASLPTAYARFKSAVDLFRLRARLPGTTPTFAEIIADPSAANLSARTDWDLSWLTTTVGWMSSPSVSGLELLLDRMDVARRVGAAPSVVVEWANPGDLTGVTDARSGEVVTAARSRYADANAWASVARPVRDLVRKAQRDALVSYLIAKEASDEIEDADDLYEEYLIDVSMNPEMLTSRIKQAGCSIQLFIHRCLFGLETHGSGSSAYDLGDWFNDDDRAAWEWMRTYRVWEAARKVFLYPENWIEPELRTDKTPFFTTLEKELSQGDVSDSRVENALLDYLDRLHEVSNLKVLASYVEKETDNDGTIDNLHVFARTRGEPATYWYRRREDSSTWTPWERVTADVQGDQLVPVVYNRRLMLLWAEFTDTQTDTEGATPASWWEVRVAMAEYRDGQWSPKKLSSEALSLESDDVDARSLSNAQQNQYGLLSNISTDNVLTVTLFAADCCIDLPEGNVLHELGTFTLDLCNMDITVSSPVAEEMTRVAIDPPSWQAPGFQTYHVNDKGGDYGNLDVYRGEFDADTGEPSGDAAPVAVLGSLQDATVVVPHQWVDFVSQAPFFINAGKRAYVVIPDTDDLADASISGLFSWREGTFPAAEQTADLPEKDAEQIAQYLNGGDFTSEANAVSSVFSAYDSLTGTNSSELLTTMLGQYAFYNFYHPHVCRFIKEVRREGVFGLLDPDPNGTAGELFRQQLVTASSEFDFEADYNPTWRVTKVDGTYPIEDIDFSDEGTYSQYNWEIFFHLPFYLASRLAEAGRFEEAIAWLHTVFDPRTREPVPTGYPDSARWWKVKPFLEPASAPVEQWVDFTGASGDAEDQAAFEAQVAAWMDDPFDPHLIARMRPGTYQKAVAMRYIDTLIAWGDKLFTRDTIESINEATQLYVYAKKVLGDRPEELDAAEEPAAKTYDQIAADLDSFGNALVALENACFSASGLGTSESGVTVADGLGYTTYFCVPPNAQLLSYWDTVEDRLFKIRNGMNIEGVVRSLPLFEPPIDPAMLVRAAAAGIDIGSALDSLDVDRPHHRFSVMVGRSQALAGAVRSLGQALLAALEKKDAEALALLRQTHEEALLEAVKAVREGQVREAQENLRALRKTKSIVKARHDYYEKLIDKRRIAEEDKASEESKWAVRSASIGAGIQAVSAIMSWFPEVFAGTLSGAGSGGTTFANALGAAASAFSMTGSALQAEAGRLTTEASYKRRDKEWAFQRGQAKHELAQVDRQIEAAEIRHQIAKKELRNHELQMEHAAAVREWMERKYTNEELYDWTVSQLATLHFQAYQLALATAKKAEACYRYELGRDTDTFIQPVYWDGLRKGLLSGEKLAADIDRMDAAYLEKDAREFELTKHVSLVGLDPLALQLLRTDGECWFEVPEVWFDADCPGHYFRRIQSVAVSLACVAGPQGAVNAQLTLHGHQTRTSAAAGDLAWEAGDYSSIVTSVAVNDSGLFSTDLRDPRYLPFERRGAVSRWHLRLTAQQWKQLDWSSITDVTLHLRYTARDGGEAFRSEVESTFLDTLAGTAVGFPGNSYLGPTAAGAPVAFSAARDAPDAWYEAQSGTTSTAFSLDVDTSMVPDISDTSGTYTYGRIVVVPVGTSLPATCTVEGGSALSAKTLGGVTYFDTGNITVSLPATLDITVNTGFASLDDLIVILLPAS